MAFIEIDKILRWVAEPVHEYIKQLEAEIERYRIACQHTVDHHEPYVDESGVIIITLQSYALIKKALGDK